MSTRRNCPRCKRTKHIVRDGDCSECERDLAEKRSVRVALDLLADTIGAADPLRAKVSASAMLAGLGGRIARA